MKFSKIVKPKELDSNERLLGACIEELQLPRVGNFLLTADETFHALQMKLLTALRLVLRHFSLAEPERNRNEAQISFNTVRALNDVRGV